METARHYFGLALAKNELKAINGDPEAQVALGNLYGGWAADLGDDGDTMKWYLRAAAQDYAEAQHIIGRCYLHGFRGVTKDLDEAVSWLRQAAEQGHLEAASELGQLYVDDSEGMLNIKEAMKWYFHAASRGHVISQVSLGSLFMSMYTKSNIRRAKDTYLNSTLYWWRKAAEWGDGYVVSNLMMYPYLVEPRTGSDQPIGRAELQFQKELFSLMKMLADAGNEEAQIYLAIYYRDGYDQIVSKDSQMAVFWLSRAADRGNREASRLMGEIEIE